MLGTKDRIEEMPLREYLSTGSEKLMSTPKLPPRHDTKIRFRTKDMRTGKVAWVSLAINAYNQVYLVAGGDWKEGRAKAARLVPDLNVLAELVLMQREGA